MTINQFVQNHGLKRLRVLDWISKGLIPGASVDRNYIPDSARIPYTKARAKRADKIYCSIVNASIRRQHVLPQLYGICQEEFDGYIRRLEQAGLIERRITDDIIYYDATIEATQYSEKFVINLVRACAQGIAQGVTEGMMAVAAV